MRRLILIVWSLFMVTTVSAQWVRVDTNANLPQPFTPAGLVAHGSDLFALSFEGPPIVVRFFHSTDAGASWTEKANLPSGLSAAPAIFTVIDGTIVISRLNGNGAFVHVMTSSDKGDTWNHYQPSGIGGPITFGLTGQGSTWYMATTTGVAVSTDAGATWSMTAASPGVPLSWVHSHGTTLYANVAGSVHRSTDGGNTWSQVVVDGLFFNLYSQIWNSGTSVFMKNSFTSTVVRSDDDGATWTQITSFSDFGYSAVLVFPGSNTWVPYATSSGGASFYTSTDLAVTATPIPNDGYPLMDNSTPCFAVPTISQDYIFVAASLCFNSNNGIYRYAYMTGTGREDHELPSVLTVEAPYPNPATGSARLRIELDAPATVQVRILDMLGREVVVAPDSARSTGTHEFDLDLTGLTAGVYMVDVRAGAASMTKQLVVARGN